MLEALADDLNTPRAVGELHRLLHESRKGQSESAAQLRASCDFLGISVTEVNLQDTLLGNKQVDRAEIDRLIGERNAARGAKNFAEADRIRDELAAMGVVLKDSKEGTTWEVAR